MSLGPASRTPESRRIALIGLILTGAVILAYAGTFRSPFEFDDFKAIVGNPTIRDLSQLGDVLRPPHDSGSTVGGRPLLNLTFALNHAASGQAVWSYHLVNLAIHLGATLLLFGLIRRLAQPRFAAPLLLATAVAATWALHPLQTESVTYLSQRAESLAGLLYLLTLYAGVRGAESPGSRRWNWVSVGACLLGVASKEVVATAPVAMLLTDRTLLAGTFAAAWRRRRSFYAGLAASWLLAGALIVSTDNRGGTAGFGTEVSSWRYLLTQAAAIVHYLRLTFWPHPQVFDYGTRLVEGLGAVWPQALAMVGVAAAAIVAFVRRHPLGCVGLCFFVLLAPSSSIVPVASQTMAEHRMYLGLAAVLVVVAAGLHRWLGRTGLAFLLVLAIVAGALTWRRNFVYRSDIALWSDTVAHVPDNARAHNNLGNALNSAGRLAEAQACFERALELQPDYADAHNNLGYLLARQGHPAEAIAHYELALRQRPRSVEVLTNYGSALAQLGRTQEAIDQHTAALRLDPQARDALYNRGNAHFARRNFKAAAQDYEDVLRLDPTRQDARFNLSLTLLSLGRVDEAEQQLTRLLEQKPDDAAALAELANIHAFRGRRAEAISGYEKALRLQPDFPAARANLERLRAASPRP